MQTTFLSAPLALAVVLAGVGLAPYHIAAQTSGAGQQAAPAAEAPPPKIPTSAFAARSLIVNPQLSPNGQLIAAQMNSAKGDLVVIFDTAGKPLDTYGMGKGQDLAWVRWAGNNKLLISVAMSGVVGGEEVRYTRLVMLDRTTEQMVFIGRNEAIVDGDDVIFVHPEGEHALLSVQRTPYEYPSVMRFDLRKDGDVKTVQGAREGVWDWVADSSGTVRLGWGWTSEKLRIFYRSAATGELRVIERVRERDFDTDRFWAVAQIVPGSDEGLVYLEDASGRVGLRRFNFATRAVGETVWAHPEWDVESAFIDDSGRLRAAYYTDDRERVHWLSEDDRKMQASLERALKQPTVWTLSRSQDEKTKLVWAGSEADPGALYVYRPQEKRMDLLAEMRPQIDFRQLAPMRAITYQARDGTPIRAYLTLPRGRAHTRLPLIVMPHGGPYGVRDSLQYNDEVQLLANRGYAVIQPNYRGSGGYGQAFEELGDGQIGRRMQDDLDDAMDWAVTQGIADAARVCVVGGSYGGYAALWAVLRNPERYRCAASWAGVTDWDSILRYDAQFFSRLGLRKWRSKIQGEKGFDLDSVSPYRHAHKLTRPVLVAQGTEDTIVPPFQYHRFVKAAAKAPVAPQTMLVKGEGHSFSNPVNEQAWYDALEAFLAKHNPADPVP